MRFSSRLALGSLTLALVAVLGACSSSPTTVRPAAGGSGKDPLQLGWTRADEAFPSATLDGLDEVSPARHATSAGAPFLLNVWASFCGPCKAELPFMQRLYQSGVVNVVGVSRDVTAAAAADQVHQDGLSYANYFDGDQRLAVALHSVLPLNGIPATALVIDGKVAWVHVGEFDSYADLVRGVRQRL